MDAKYITENYISEDHWEKVIQTVERILEEEAKLDAIGWADNARGRAVRSQRRFYIGQRNLLVQHLPVAVGTSILNAAKRVAAMV